MCLIKNVIPYIVVPLKHIFNLSLMNGVFPDSMKIARVIPLFKSGNTKEFSNYRHISLLPQFSKILEQFITIDRWFLLIAIKYCIKASMDSENKCQLR